MDYDDNFKTPQVAGKNVSFDIEVSEVREKILPELTDELVKKIDQTCANVDEWKTKLTSEINARCESENKQKKEQAVLDAL